VRHLRGMRRGEADATEPGDPARLAKEAREVPAVATVRVHRLAEEDDLAHALVGEPAHLLDEQWAGQASLATAHVRDDAERAEAIAAAHDRDPRAHARLARDRQIG